MNTPGQSGSGGHISKKACRVVGGAPTRVVDPSKTQKKLMPGALKKDEYLENWGPTRFGSECVRVHACV